MNRKIIRQGKGGYTIYLPKKWVDSKGLKAGDQVSLVESDNTLLIGSHAKERKEKTIRITEENKKDIKNILTHLYRNGFDSITITDIDDQLLDEIKGATSLLLGFEVTERDAKQCRIENISEPTEQKYDVLLRRNFLIIKDTQNIILKDFEDENFKNLREIEELRNQQDKFILFCRRILAKEKYERNPLTGWELLTFLMHIEHAYYYLYKYAAESNMKKNREAVELLKELGGYFDLLYDANFKREIRNIHKINSLKNKFQFGKCLALIEKSEGKDSVVFSYIRELFRLIQLATSPILSEIIESEI